MDPNRSRKILRDTGLIAFVVVGYWFLGSVSKFSVLPPMDISIFWLPAGWNVAWIGLIGARGLIATLIGAWSWNAQSIDIVPALAIAVAQATQAFVISRCLATIKKSVLSDGKNLLQIPNVPSSGSTYSPYSTYAPYWLGLAFLIAPTAGSTILIISGLNAASQSNDLWLSWFIGDIFGVLTVTPAVLVARQILTKQTTSSNYLRAVFTPWLFAIMGVSLGTVHWYLERASFHDSTSLTGVTQDAITVLIAAALPIIGWFFFRLTQQKQTLAIQRATNGTILSALDEAVSVHSRDGDLVYANDRFRKLFSTVSAQTNLFLLLGEKGGISLKQTRENNHALKEGGAHLDSARTVEFEMIFDSLTYLVRVDSFSTPEIQDALLVVTRDVTGRRVAQENLLKNKVALENSERQLRSVIASSPAIIFSCTQFSDLDFLYIGGRVKEYFGVDVSECLKKSWFMNHVLQEDRAQLIEKLAGHPNDAPMSCEFRLSTPHRGTRWMRCESVLAKSSNVDESPVIVGHIKDVEDEKRRAIAEITSQKNEAIGQLTGGLAHDFNNLLGVVVGNLDLLARKVEGDEKAQHAHHNALQAAIRGAEVTRSLLAVARRQPMEINVVDLNALIVEMLPLVRSSAGSAITLRSQLSPGELLAPIDSAGLSNAVLNLANNARDAMREQTTQKCISLRTSTQNIPQANALNLKPGIYACLEVQDNGPGMSEQVRSQAFEPFFTTKARGHGTGLGLAMVRGFAEQLGGTAHIDSHPGSGTTVRIFVPTRDRG